MRYEIEDLLYDLVGFCLKMFLYASIAALFVLVDVGLVVTVVKGGWVAALFCVPVGVVINVGAAWLLVCCINDKLDRRQSVENCSQ